MKILLKAKSWQLFIGVFGTQLIYQIITIFMIRQNPSLIDGFIMYKPFVVSISALIFFMWIWQIAITVNNMNKEDNQGIVFFKSAFIFVIAYLLIMVISQMWLMDYNRIFLIPHIISLILLIYCLLFVSKVLKKSELGRKVGVGDYLGDFLLILMFPIGIWIIQPRINSLIINNEK